MTDTPKTSQELTNELVAQIDAIRFPKDEITSAADHKRLRAALDSLQTRYRHSVPTYIRN